MSENPVLTTGLICLALFVLATAIFLTGCSADNPYVDAWNQGVEQAESQLAADQQFRDECIKSYFEKVGQDEKYSFVLYRDLRTDVMYCFYWRKSGYGAGSALSVMYAADGSPLIYSEWLALEADQEGGAAE